MTRQPTFWDRWLKEYLPTKHTEMHRKLRSIKYANFWKGVEFGYFLNYAGLVVLKPHLPNELYNQHKNVAILCCNTAFVKRLQDKVEDSWATSRQICERF